MSQDELEDICVYYHVAKSQREMERKKGLGKKGTMGYEDMGCYRCNGHDKTCISYMNTLELYGRGLNNE